MNNLQNVHNEPIEHTLNMTEHDLQLTSIYLDFHFTLYLFTSNSISTPNPYLYFYLQHPILVNSPPTSTSLLIFTTTLLLHFIHLSIFLPSYFQLHLYYVLYLPLSLFFFSLLVYLSFLPLSLLQSLVLMLSKRQHVFTSTRALDHRTFWFLAFIAHPLPLHSTTVSTSVFNVIPNPITILLPVYFQLLTSTIILPSPLS